MLKITGSHFTDQYGRQMILHGVNMVCKNKREQYIGNWNEIDFRKLHEWGMNVIRFGVSWDGVEPEPHQYNNAYIEKLRELIQLANKYKLFIILDMHQDLYSSEFGNGAPKWATFSNGEISEPGTVWSDAYLFNHAVQNAFDHFWNNTEAADGIGIQEHYAQAWAYVVKKLHNEPNIIGYDLMNEPFIGSAVSKVTEQLFTTFLEHYNENMNQEVGVDSFFSAWDDPQMKEKYVSLLEDKNIFRNVIDSPSPIIKEFEGTTLTAFYENVAHAIRKIDRKRVIFIEANYFSNLGIKSGIKPLRHATGERDPNQAYAPHAYDLVTDTDLAHTANDKRLEFIFHRHAETKRRLEMPMLIGEWGAFYNTDNTAHVSIGIQRFMENYLCSDTYWHYTRDMDQSLSFAGIQRGYPVGVNGNLLSYRYEPSISTFQMTWIEKNSSNQPTEIYLPDVRGLNVTLSPVGSIYHIRQTEESHAGFILIPPAGNNYRSLVIIAGAK